MTDPTVRDWREMTHMHAGADTSECAACAPHRYTYPADVGGVPAGTKFDRDINAPSHYTHLPVEAIDITEHFNFNMGNALKYIWRADFKGDPIKDLKKAAWYINREIARREQYGQ